MIHPKHAPIILTLLLLAAVTISITACKKSDTQPQQKPVDSLSTNYILATNGFLTVMPITGTPAFNPPDSHFSLFTYKNGKVTSRRGGILPMLTGGVIYSLFVYDTVTYKGNQVQLETYCYVPGIIVDANPRVFVVKNNLPQSYTSATDTTIFHYTGNHLVDMETSQKTLQIRREVTYSGDDIVLITSTATNRADNSTAYTQVENFANYDQVKTRLKAFWMWPDLFYRAMSYNNFAVYNNIIQNGTDHTSQQQKITISYLPNGLVDYTK